MKKCKRCGKFIEYCNLDEVPTVSDPCQCWQLSEPICRLAFAGGMGRMAKTCRTAMRLAGTREPASFIDKACKLNQTDPAELLEVLEWMIS